MQKSSLSTLETPIEMRSSLYPYVKRVFDVVFSLSFIIIFSPLYLLIALLIKCDSPGPIFYVTTRLGKGGKHITVMKFRTMYVDAEERLMELLKQDSNLKREWDIFQKLKEDPRCTKIGKFLRRTSLDELPQFFNVLKGDLSVVGPRPHFIFELEKKKESPLQPHAHKILSIKPGITCIWQTSGRSHLSYEDRVKLDCLYAEKYSFALDLYLIIKTIPSLLFSKGAF